MGGGGSGGAPAATGGGLGSGGAPGSGGVPLGSGGAPLGSGGVHTGSGGVHLGSGGVPAGSGGVPAGSGGGGSTTVMCTTGGAETLNGYIDNGTMCGYAWTGMNKNAGAAIPGQSIDPPCGTATGAVCFTGATVCATAEIPANDPPAYSGVMIGWNVSQANGSDTAGTWNATGTGITVTFNDGGATGVVRVLVQSAGTDYCADAAASPATFTWAQFKKECYNATPGAAFAAGSPVTAIAVQVNGSDTAAQSLTDFCLTSVALNP